MTQGSRDVDRAVSRTLRETLNALQRTAEELNQALNDLVSACGSTRPTNALPPILRAQTAAASLAASLDVLSRFVASSSSPEPEVVEEEEAPAPQTRGRSIGKRPEASPQSAGSVEAPPASQSPTLDISPDLD